MRLIPNVAELNIAVSILLRIENNVTNTWPAFRSQMHLSRAAVLGRLLSERAFEIGQFLHLRQKPRIDIRDLVNLLDGPAHL